MKKVFVEHLSGTTIFNENVRSGATNFNKNDKIPPYVEQFRKEWLYIRGINKECERTYNKINEYRLIN